MSLYARCALAALLSALVLGTVAADDGADKKSKLKKLGKALKKTAIVEEKLTATPEGAPFKNISTFDADFSVEEKDMRMQACMVYTLRLVDKRKAALMGWYSSTHTEEDQPYDEALQGIIGSWMMACYINIGDADMNKIHDESISADDENFGVSDRVETEVFKLADNKMQSDQVSSASEAQWELLQSVYSAHLDKEGNPQERQWETPEQPQADTDTRKMPDFSQWHASSNEQASAQTAGGTQSTSRKTMAPMLLVLGLVFGLLILAVMRLSDSEAPEKLSKAARKEEKAKKKQK